MEPGGIEFPEEFNKDIGELVLSIVSSVLQDIARIREFNVEKIKNNFAEARRVEVEKFIKGREYLSKSDKEALKMIRHRWDIYESALRIFDITLEKELETYFRYVIGSNGLIFSEFFGGDVDRFKRVADDAAATREFANEIEQITQEITTKHKQEGEQ